MLAPTIDALAEQYAGRVKVGKMDADLNSTPSQFGIRGIPTLLLFREGKIVDQIVGVVPQEVIAGHLDQALVN